jgi:PAS domain S-box-containing protein
LGPASGTEDGWVPHNPKVESPGSGRPPRRHEFDRRLGPGAVEASGVGFFDWDFTTGVLSWDERLRRLFGYDENTFDGTIEAFNARVHPDDLPRVTLALQRAIEGCGEYQAEYRVVLPDGSVRWLAARGRVSCDPAGRAVRLLGAAYDTSLHRQGEARVVEVLEAMPAAFFSLDSQWRFSYVNTEAEKLLGLPREDLLGRDLWQLFPAAVGSDFEVHYRRAAAEQEPVAFEAYYPDPLNAWYEVRAWPSPAGLSVYFLNITERRTAQEAAARAARRAVFLSAVNEQLGATLDAEQAVASFARLMVPALADWCLITVVEAGAIEGDWRRGLRDLGWAHARPDDVHLVEGYAQSRLEALTDRSPLARALRDGRPVLVRADAMTEFVGSLAPGPAQDFMRRLAPQSAVVIPLHGRDRTVGLITLYNGAGRPPMGEDDLATVLDASVRAGLALDNARLYSDQRRLAEGLQRSMLTEPPGPDHLEVSVRYEAAAEAAQVGGDWYDSFLQRDGSTVIVIGDVIGHDTAAAAAMGQLRGLLRGVAARTGDGPADVLEGVDEVMDLLQVDTTATVVVARLEQTPEERQAGLRRLRWSNAGHPPPIVIDGDGNVHALTPETPDLLLGVNHLTGPRAPRRQEMVTTLHPGSTVLLYTDGLVERRDQPLDQGLVLLQQTLVQLAGLPLQQLCDRLLERMLPPRPEDDVAIVALRLHPEDQPRPAEAGPQRLPVPLQDQ